MYNNMLDNLNRQKERIDEMIRTYSQPQPVNNYINTQTPSNNLIEWRILNENEEVDNLYVQNKTLFINGNMMILKGVDGSLEKWKVKKIYPIDKKDKKISQLEEEIKKLKEIKMEYEEKVCEFKRYAKQTLDLMVDAYKWKVMAEECDKEEMKEKYMSISHTLFDMFMIEHNNIGKIFKEE